jgi:predicted nucleotidyltransferase
MTVQDITTDRRATDQRAVKVAREIHRMAEPEQTILFGSRARGDYRPDSDIDVLIIKKHSPTEEWLDDLRRRARSFQKAYLPEASGMDVICMTTTEFDIRRHLRNNLANSIAKHGAQILPQQHHQSSEESIDWADVDGKINDATGASEGLVAIAQAGILDALPDKQFGRMAQNALENAYKAVLAAHGFEYPTSRRDGHNLRMLTDLIRRNHILPPDTPVPGEEHRYLTEFGGAALYSHEHLSLDKVSIARDVPQAVAALRDLMEKAKSDA